MKLLQFAILQCAASLVPSDGRPEWLREWQAELWYARELHGGKQITAFCLGAFRDALWLWRNRPGPKSRKTVHLESPWHCLSFLAFLAAVSLFFAFRLPGARDAILPFPYRNADNLVMIATDGRFPTRRPSVSAAEYLSLKDHAKHLFADLAFYQSVRMSVRTAQRQTGKLSVAVASSNLLPLLGIPVPKQAERRFAEAIILSDAARRKYFGEDSRVLGRVLEIGGQQATVAGIASANLRRLPGQPDALLLKGEQRLAVLPSQAKGFVFGRMKTPALHTQWSVSVPNESGNYVSFELAPVTKGKLILVYLLMILPAVLVLPVTTSVALGGYPVNSLLPPATRIRRWVFLVVKIALTLVIIIFGVLDLAAISSVEIQAHGLLLSYVLAFRWILRDQRARCPVCLRRLTHLVRYGQPSRTFLEWYGTELMCEKGHGLLYVPEILASSCSAQHWLYLDRSWSGLFSRG